MLSINDVTKIDEKRKQIKKAPKAGPASFIANGEVTLKTFGQGIKEQVEKNNTIKKEDINIRIKKELDTNFFASFLEFFP